MKTLAALAAVSFLRPCLGGISPGPLSRSHAELDGPLQCLKCHGSGTGPMRELCLGCHKEISWLSENARGLHGQQGKGDCLKCHAEHAGRETSPVRFPEGRSETFDHRQAGWLLTGRHASVKCMECHKPSLQISEVVRLSLRKNREGSFQGLERDCASCHRDVHEGTLGRDCKGCHDTPGWRPAKGFDHARTRFQLTGGHVGLACAKCHLAPATGASAELSETASEIRRVFSPLKHEECAACHRDPHEGRLGGPCARCHSMESFHRVAKQSFDHARTRYPLNGRHASVECARCHDPATAGGRKPPFGACGSCHRDAHAGQATLAGKNADCSECHTVEGFRPSTFTAARHQDSGFPLQGKHLPVRCATCHPGSAEKTAVDPRLGTAGIALRRPHSRCADCHKDAHGGQLAARADHGECASCHRVDGWKPSTYTAKEHAALRVALVGRHALECAACHGPERKNLPPMPNPETMGSARVWFAVMKGGGCVACHVGPHGDQFAKRADRGVCEGCHGEESFRPASRFDHDRQSRFPLLAAHGRLACERCHDRRLDDVGRVVTVFRLVNNTCNGCHREKCDPSPAPGTKQPPGCPAPETEKSRRHRLSWNAWPGSEGLPRCG